ncbi:hypothetical protein [Mycolicibacterium smegmatis]|jgi:hypothetical protein|uniref:PASTA domain-containing protein n=3 Tax=Mycolicibacterium smegmatis TaxID=1772 RepID=I7GDW8_MYCS2|nr:hypothetical protein [Mycolicibacterium smegmatis]ABK71389.1 hypothetical protein MSMEG_5321 [Mycolicibacterium smegmatis MC2 155]AFP41621.1 hypothetical protein MSMEI_5177 [Mycolicibacterium smegmatis MC2 155]AIU10349.1 hypothetical protein LJ00_26300 [Mycolicibacterium smegmatis MC2 155]AIU16974.1 hypothetical protein LI99_26305 [Mycolicibacterium smegmatis]AIU23597.1 hypothetical protein LI98_26310 [Mycolicibacterium smegmatis]
MTSTRTRQAFAAAGAGAAALSALLAFATPAHAESAALTIGQLEAQGFDVRVDRVGSAPLEQCVVTGIRNPRERTRIVRFDGPRGRDRLVPVVVQRSITVSLDCSRR